MAAEGKNRQVLRDIGNLHGQAPAAAPDKTKVITLPIFLVLFLLSILTVF